MINKHLRNITLLALGFLAPLGSHAAVIGSFGTVTNLDNNSTGAVVDNSLNTDLAWLFSGADATVNGVTFTTDGTNDSFTQGGITATLSSTFGDMNVDRLSNRADNIVDSDLQALLQGGAFMIGTSSPFDLTFSGLTTGTEYQLQFLVFDDGSSHNITISETDIGSVALGNFFTNNGRSVIATFTTDTGDATFSLTGTRPLLSAVHLSSAVAAIPEPSTYGLIVGVLAVFSLCVIKRRRSA